MKVFEKDIENILREANYDFDKKLTETEVSKLVDLVRSELLKKNFIDKHKRKKLVGLKNNVPLSIMQFDNLTSKTIKLKNNAYIKKIEEAKIGEFVIQFLIKNKDLRLKTTTIVEELKKQKNLVHKDYYNLRTRTYVYSVISNLRKQMEKDNFVNGYIVSKHNGNPGIDKVKKVDGWEYTESFIKIENYFKNEIDEYNSRAKSMEKKLLKFKEAKEI
ncbi:hypothetical protein [Spiroplasma monobiae]|uniref:Uncharacterized protein n=1 Tax=Spiroplasma monobiae MQ-1 TaxID=1336748 RepID=A0A2K9LUP2_SPISQ|nr:hypothetical protein [Spiroplasma monobiae]AUM62766.1 hypothetical protein SMONO_v1c05170 [Spiroplasma monobiae MQ-1]